MQRTVLTVSNETKFFDVECVDSARDLKELRRLFKRIFARRVAKWELYVFQKHLRLRVELHKYTTIDFAAIQEDILNPRVIFLRDPLAEPVAEVLDKIVASPVDIPVTTIAITKQSDGPNALPVHRVPSRVTIGRPIRA